MKNEIKTINDIVSLETIEDKNSLQMLMAEKTADDNLPPQAYCPICRCDLLQIEEIAEGDTERGVYKYKCLDCGTIFYLLEDLTASCRRGIANAENKIKYFETKLKGG
ncbi:MAG: hypothetical protein LUG16_03765 [Candidatus Gastranaerophilales bacterium]|nr:hypothetical protein [Candidatus Gastranaerophilales bacterium]